MGRSKGQSEIKRLIAEIRSVLDMEPPAPAVLAYGGAFVHCRVYEGLYPGESPGAAQMKLWHALIEAGLFPSYYQFEGGGIIVRANPFPPPNHTKAVSRTW